MHDVCMLLVPDAGAGSANRHSDAHHPHSNSAGAPVEPWPESVDVLGRSWIFQFKLVEGNIYVYSLYCFG